MEITLAIDTATCIRCGKCVRVCPSGIFTQQKPDGNTESRTTETPAGNDQENTPASSFKNGFEIRIVNPETCIVCGHCVAACPTGSVEHGDFPAGKVHKIDYGQLPTPEQVLLLCKARRSNRAITSKPVPPEKLGLILEAAHRAPTASNSQSVSFTVVTDPKKLLEVSDFTIRTFDKVRAKLQNPLLKPVLKPLLPGLYRYVPIFERLKRNHLAGNDPILRHATALIFIHTPASHRFGAADANLAYQNGSLMAESLGISQVYMGFVLSALQQDPKSLARTLGIEGRIHAVMALGVPAFRYPNYIDRKEVQVQQI